MNPADNLVLIGLRGSGKTSVARVLAQRLQRTGIDSDEWLENQTHARIGDLLRTRGDAEFRRLEQAALAEILKQPGQVVSVGGGAVLAEENRRLLRSASCVWLTAPTDVLLARIQADPHSAATRPALTALSPAAELQLLSDQRAPLYRELARAIIDTSGRTVAEVAEAVLAALQSAAGSSAG